MFNSSQMISEDDFIPIEDKRTYKVYILENKINKKIYIGQTVLSYTKRMGKNGCNYNNSIYLYNALQHYGIENFQYTTLIECIGKDYANAHEAYYVELFRSRDLEIGYNLREGGYGGTHSEETKAKIAKSMMGRPMSAENIARITGNSFALGYKHTDEWKENNSEFIKNRHMTQGHPMKGRHHTLLSKIKISFASKDSWEKSKIRKNMGRPKMSKERETEIITAYQTGQTIKSIEEQFGFARVSIYRVLNRNGIEKHGCINTWEGKTHSTETKEKMSNTAKGLWEERKK